MAQIMLAVFVIALVPVSPALSAQFGQNQNPNLQGLIQAAQNPELAVNPTVDPTLPPDFDQAGIANKGQLFNDCSGQIKDAITQGIEQIGALFGSGKSSSGFGAVGSVGSSFGTIQAALNMPCTNDIAPTADSMTCESLAPATGVPTPDVLR
jgi:hypothetical protein